MKSKRRLLLICLGLVVAVLFYALFASTWISSGKVKNNLDTLIAPALNTNFLTNPISDFCASIGLETSLEDSRDTLRCVQRSGGYVLIQELQDETYYCVDTFGGSNTFKLDQYYMVPAYCDLDLAIDKILVEQNKLFSELQQLMKTNNASAENQEKF
jgi:hypothetical protein